METPLLYAISLFAIDTPWYGVACVPYLDKLKIKRRTLLLIIIACGLFRAIIGYLSAAYLPNWRAYRSLHLILHTLFMFAVYWTVVKARPAQLAYTLLLLHAVSTTINMSAYIVNVPMYPEETKIGIATQLGHTLTIVIGNALVIPFVIRFFKGSLRSAFNELSENLIWLLCIPPILFLFLHQIFLSLVDKTEIPPLSIAWLVLVILSTGLISYYINLRTVLGQARSLRKEHEMETQLALQFQGYDNIKQTIEQTRQIRHDWRHQVNVIYDFARRQDSQGLIDYLKEYRSTLPIDKVTTWCENQPVNALLNYYLGQAQEVEAQLDIKLNLPEQTGINEVDLCVIFGNIFENAVKSIKTVPVGEGVIRARCDTNEREVVLVVENSLPQSAIQGQGIGLKSVETLADKYNGSTRFFREGQYHSQVLLRSR